MYLDDSVMLVVIQCMLMNVVTMDCIKGPWSMCAEMNVDVC